jgi:hypothetical protein
MFRIFNKTYQPMILIDGTRIAQRGFAHVQKITDQLRNLEMRGLIIIRKV